MKMRSDGPHCMNARPGLGGGGGGGGGGGCLNLWIYATIK